MHTVAFSICRYHLSATVSWLLSFTSPHTYSHDLAFREAETDVTGKELAFNDDTTMCDDYWYQDGKLLPGADA